MKGETEGYSIYPICAYCRKTIRGWNWQWLHPLCWIKEFFTGKIEEEERKSELEWLAWLDGEEANDDSR